MAKYPQTDRDELVNWCRQLDSNLVLSSDKTPFYNCIAWAMGIDDMWVAPQNPYLTGWEWWPPSVPLNDELYSLIRAFQYFGFENCDDDSDEEGYEKVALYQKGGKWKHAARVISHDVYQSKFGADHDAYHSSDREIFKDVEYGVVYAYLKRALDKKGLLHTLRPTVSSFDYGHERHHIHFDSSGVVLKHYVECI